jgi:hyperosmotically inducible periplasmic protein
MPRRVVPLLVPLTTVLVLIGIIATASDARSSDLRTTTSIARALEQLPCYGVFDHLTFTVNHGNVTLDGYSYDASLATSMAAIVVRLPGVARVINNVQPLPTSTQDEWIRHAVFDRVYQDDFLSRYAPGGRYSIHIVVRSGHVLLRGVVESDDDKKEAVLRARAVIGTFAVDDELLIGQR